MTKSTENNNIKIKIVAAVLDWGLGHTTRCLPIFKEMVAQGFELSIACTESQARVLRSELPLINYHRLKGYNITYPRKKWMFPLKIITQLPKILYLINYEKRWLKRYVKTHKVDVVFSDNRPGFRSRNVLSIYMTHQLSVQTGYKFSNRISSALHQRLINNFNECWVPDDKSHTLSGNLSKTKSLKTKLRFIGPLSRMKENSTSYSKYRLACVLSGPEPQRSILEESLVSQLKALPFNAVIIRGRSDQRSSKAFNSLKIIDYMDASELAKVMKSSNLILSRAGYSTIMDLVKLGCKAVLIPTPGQGEQEYLARYMFENKHFMIASQGNFNIEEIVNISESFAFKPISVDFAAFKTTVTDLKNRVIEAGKPGSVEQNM